MALSVIELSEKIRNQSKGRLLLLRLGITGGIILFLLYKIDIGSSFQLLSFTRVKLLALSLLVYIFGKILCTYKWKILLSSLGKKRDFFQLVKFYFIGMFFSLFMPTNIGGDGVRIYLASSLDDFPDVTSSVFMERSTGFFALFAIATIASLMTPLDFNGHPLAIFIILTFVTFIVLFFIFLKPWFYNLASSLLRRCGFTTLADKVQDMWQVLSFLLKRKKVLAWAMVYSFIFQLAVVTINVINAKALGIELPLRYFFVIIPVTAVIALLPITVNGLGIRESAYVILFAQVGLSPEEGLSLAVLWLLVLILSALPGAVFYILFPKGGKGSEEEG